MHQTYWIGDPKLILPPEIYTKAISYETYNHRMRYLRSALCFYEAKIEPMGFETYTNTLFPIERPEFAPRLTSEDFTLVRSSYKTESRYVCFVPAQSANPPDNTVVFASKRTPTVNFNSTNPWYTSITILVAGFGSVAATRTPTGERRMYK